jgi:hypothetical protein
MKKIFILLLPVALLISANPAQASLSTSSKVSDTVLVKELQKTLKLSKVRYLKTAARYNIMILKDKKNSGAYQSASRGYSNLALKAELISSKLSVKTLTAPRKLSIDMHLDALDLYKKLVASRK